VAIKRIVERDKLSESEARLRVGAQLSVEEVTAYIRTVTLPGEFRAFDTSGFTTVAEGLRDVEAAFRVYYDRRIRPMVADNVLHNG
jgi:hypothetical protein